MFFQYKNSKNMFFGKKDHEMMDQLVSEFSIHFNMHIMNNQLKIIFNNKNIKQIINGNIMEFQR